MKELIKQITDEYCDALRELNSEGESGGRSSDSYDDAVSKAKRKCVALLAARDLLEATLCYETPQRLDIPSQIGISNPPNKRQLTNPQPNKKGDPTEDFKDF